MTEMEKSKHSWQGERGLINKEMLAKYLKGAASPIYYMDRRPWSPAYTKCSKKPESTMTISVKKSSLATD
jgi:hypothetical protein